MSTDELRSAAVMRLYEHREAIRRVAAKLDAQGHLVEITEDGLVLRVDGLYVEVL